ncbi:hypothetical protein T440DRAFT_118905, partial [Plenodomus tracheiphilus IPT5]
VTGGCCVSDGPFNLRARLEVSLPHANTLLRTLALLPCTFARHPGPARTLPEAWACQTWKHPPEPTDQVLDHTRRPGSAGQIMAVPMMHAMGSRLRYDRPAMVRVPDD